MTTLLSGWIDTVETSVVDVLIELARSAGFWTLGVLGGAVVARWRSVSE